MKHLKLLLVLTGAIFLFFSCSKDDSTVIPDQPKGDQETPVYKAKEITDFTGVCNFMWRDDGNYWLDDATDERVSGVSLWVIEGGEGDQFWGTAELFVGAEDVGDDYDGKWEMKWWGTETEIIPDEENLIVALVVGTGTEGNVKGMFAEWTYTMNYNPETYDGFFYTFEGYLASKQLTNTLKMNNTSGSMEIQFPGNTENDCGGDLFRLYTSGSGNCTHLGLFGVTNEVCVYFDGPNIVPVSDWLGYMTAANGDMINTQMIYSYEMDGLSYYIYDILGGDGRFDGASGYIETYGSSELDPVQLIGTWELGGEGTIVH